MYFLT